MENIAIEYRFLLSDGSDERICLQIDPQKLELVGNRPDTLPSWTMLGYHQCPNCPLESHITPICPLAANLVVLVKPCSRVVSYDRIKLEVTTRERTIVRETKAELAISSLMGLINATSGCPLMAFFKPMARFHLPLASQEETMFRAVSAYLMSQYLRKRQGHELEIELGKLETVYEEVKTVNRAVADRLRAAAKTDAALNALVILDVHAQLLPFAIKEDMARFDYLFVPFWLSQP